MNDVVRGIAPRISRKMTEGQGGMMPVYPDFKSQCKLLCKTIGSVMLIAATALALGVGGRMTTSRLRPRIDRSNHRSSVQKSMGSCSILPIWQDAMENRPTSWYVSSP